MFLSWTNRVLSYSNLVWKLNELQENIQTWFVWCNKSMSNKLLPSQTCARSRTAWFIYQWKKKAQRVQWAQPTYRRICQLVGHHPRAQNTRPAGPIGFLSDTSYKVHFRSWEPDRIAIWESKMKQGRRSGGDRHHKDFKIFYCYIIFFLVYFQIFI